MTYFVLSKRECLSQQRLVTRLTVWSLNGGQVEIPNHWGDVLSLVVAIGGLGAAGYHIPMHRSGKSKVCDNRFSYVIMVTLSIFCMGLLASVLF